MPWKFVRTAMVPSWLLENVSALISHDFTPSGENTNLSSPTQSHNEHVSMMMLALTSEHHCAHVQITALYILSLISIPYITFHTMGKEVKGCLQRRWWVVVKYCKETCHLFEWSWTVNQLLMLLLIYKKIQLEKCHETRHQRWSDCLNTLNWQHYRRQGGQCVQQWTLLLCCFYGGW